MALASRVVARFGGCRAGGNGCQTMMGQLAALAFAAGSPSFSAMGRNQNSNKIPAILARGPTVSEFACFKASRRGE
jgi:hypothetical protein